MFIFVQFSRVVMPDESFWGSVLLSGETRES